MFWSQRPVDPPQRSGLRCPMWGSRGDCGALALPHTHGVGPMPLVCHGTGNDSRMTAQCALKSAVDRPPNIFIKKGSIGPRKLIVGASVRVSMVRVRARGSGRYVLSGWPAVLPAVLTLEAYGFYEDWVGTKLTAIFGFDPGARILQFDSVRPSQIRRASGELVPCPALPTAIESRYFCLAGSRVLIVLRWRFSTE